MDFSIVQSVSSSVGEYRALLNKNERKFDYYASPASWEWTSTEIGMGKPGTDGCSRTMSTLISPSLSNTE